MSRRAKALGYICPVPAGSVRTRYHGERIKHTLERGTVLIRKLRTNKVNNPLPYLKFVFAEKKCKILILLGAEMDL